MQPAPGPVACSAASKAAAAPEPKSPVVDTKALAPKPGAKPVNPKKGARPANKPQG